MYCELAAVRLRHLVTIVGNDVVTRAPLYNVASKVDPNVPSFVLLYLKFIDQMNIKLLDLKLSL